MWIMVVKIQHEDINVPHFTGDQEAKVVHASKEGKTTKVFPAMEWLGRHVFSYNGEGRADGAELWILQHYQILQFEW
jgi:hypothetical protein